MHVDLDICIHVDDAYGANVVHGIDVCLCLYDDDHDMFQERLVRLAQGGRPGDLAKGLGVRLSSDQCDQMITKKGKLTMIMIKVKNTIGIIN